MRLSVHKNSKFSVKQVSLFCVTCNRLLPVKRVLVDTQKKDNNITVNIFIIIEDN